MFSFFCVYYSSQTFITLQKLLLFMVISFNVLDSPLSRVSPGHHLSTNQCFSSTAFILLYSPVFTPPPPHSLTYCTQRSVSHLPGFLRQTLCDGESLLEVSFCGKQQLSGVFGEELFKQLSLCEGFTFQQMTRPSRGQRDQREGRGGRGYYNDFLKSLCRGYKLYSLSHFSQWCVTHLLCFASFHATPGCVWECGVVSGG